MDESSSGRIGPSRIFDVFEGVDRGHRFLFTKNIAPGFAVYGEDLFTQDGVEYREWIANKSKLCSLILKGAQSIFIKKGSSVLYLGCASGTTVSHVSDIVGDDGVVFAVDISPTVMRDMLLLCQKRQNIIPILESASMYDEMARRIMLVDMLFQDIAQRDQVGIFLRNLELFVKDRGYGILAVKARSIDVAKNPKIIFRDVRAQLESACTIIDYKELDPFQKDHCVFIVKRR